MRKLKSLYKLARNEAFIKDYWCIYCDIMEFDKDYMDEHVKYYHDEIGKAIRLFRCRKCYWAKMFEKDIMEHIAKYH